MAIMYPETYPKEFNADDPEFIVFNELKKLPDKYVIFYSQKFIGKVFTENEREIDFIIYDQKNNLICIEVKGGLLHYDGSNDEWFQNNKKLVRNPDRQASSATQVLIQNLGKDIKDINVGWALCFPQCQLQKNAKLIPNIPNEIIIDERHLIDIESAIESVNSYYKKKYNKSGHNKNQADALIKKLTNDLGFIHKLGVKIRKNNEQLLQVTEEQFEILNDLEFNPRIIVRGGAGTGKTLLAQEFSRRLSDKGLKVLLLFFNRTITKTIRYGLRDYPNITVSTFHSYAKRKIEGFDLAWWETAKTEMADKDDFWNIEVPIKLLEMPITEKFDAIIVDEGQDFKAEWYEYLDEILSENTSTYFCVFLDEKQDIFKHWSGIPWEEKPFRKHLTKNCRNTKKIVAFLEELSTSSMVPYPNSPIGIDVIFRKVNGPIDEQKKVIEDIKNLVNENDVSAGDIIILSNLPKNDSCLSDCKKIGSHKLLSLGDRYDNRSKDIHYTSINTFKGLEADVILIIDTTSISQDDLANALYTQGSRARNLLYIYQNEI